LSAFCQQKWFNTTSPRGGETPCRGASRLRSQAQEGGSISYYTLSEKAPVFLELYRSPAFIDFISQLVDHPVMPCPEDDPHACALYFYTEPRLIGLVQRSAECRLICQLYKGDATRAMQELRLTTPPGAMVIFNGNKLWHGITPIESGEERVVLTMEYVANPAMGALSRFVSNMKDAIAYFGFSAVLRGALSRRSGKPPQRSLKPPNPAAV
jgi:hypothetical protein